MEDLKKVKEQLNELLQKVEAMSQSSVIEDGIYKFTEKELQIFVKSFLDEFMERTREEIGNLEFNGEDSVELSINYDNTIEIELDSDNIVKQIFNTIDLTYSEDEFIDSIDVNYRNAKKILYKN